MTTPTPTRGKPGRKPDPMTAVITDVRALAAERLNIPLRGGANPDRAQGHYADRAASWERIYAERDHPDGRDAHMLARLYRALGATEASTARGALLDLAADALAAVADLDKAA
ncbi:hypothetical protein Afil01_62370 [Actinorhabdospora filicis]|uniref:Uncharacterized protein n=1 Tax=Actinorhabdospora filicis TaxID=1785913 RepID=A0A9W6SR55_9ACTN|nr:hypothetical protein [Actinorhabdospora filicis]GLZ81430.1 hypothetical protein Afil01_62370 [Actinorhabdospora filicis]